MVIVVYVAGMGTRLGMGVPKGLVTIGRKLLIDRQMQELQGLGHHVRVVVGYKAKEMKERLTYYPNVEVFENPNYATTNVADSIRIATKDLEEEVLVIAGDTVFFEGEIRKVVEHRGWVVGVKKKTSDSNPVFVRVEKGEAVQFSRKSGTCEWASVGKIHAQTFRRDCEYAYHAFEKHLPLPVVEIDVMEVDTQKDLEAVEKWMIQKAQR